MNKKSFSIVLLFLFLQVLSGCENDKAQKSFTIADGIFKVKKCIPSKMAPGYTMIYPLEGTRVYWFKEGEVVHVAEMPGNVHFIRQSKQGIYGIVNEKCMCFDEDGKVIFMVDNLPGYPHHDMIKTSIGTYLTLVRVFLTPDSKEWKRSWYPLANGKTFEDVLSDDLIIEFDKSGKILWRWSVNKHLLGKRDGAKNLSFFKENWVHSNSLDIFENGDILLSARNLNEIVRIKYPSGEIVWRRGGGILSLQHHATIQPDGSILVYNNGVKTLKTGKTGIVKFSPSGKILLNSFHTEIRF